MANQNCQLCGHGCRYNHDDNSFDCPRCGKYKMAEECASELRKGQASLVTQNLERPDVLSELAVYLHDHNSADRVPTLEPGQLQRVRPLTVVERMDRLLVRVGARLARPSSPAIIKRDAPWQVGGYDDRDVKDLAAMLAERGDVTDNRDASVAGCFTLRLTAAGWARAAELTRVTTGHQAFVAMAFTPQMTEIRHLAFDPAIRAAGYDPFLVSDREHNGRIDDRIEYEIKNSVFVVADFTEHRGGVYYEAGFAQGLGKAVIWTVEKRHVKKLHFDTRQFNHIVWSDAEELRTRLEARILNTVGKGPAA